MVANLTENRLLAGLSRPGREALRPMLCPVSLPRRERLATRGEAIPAVYFLTSGIASIVGQIAHEPPMEIAVVGREGFVGLPVLLADGVTRFDTFMQVGGEAWRLPAARLDDAMDSADGLRSLLARFAAVSWVQAASTVVANGRATTVERLARWLLMCNDRIGGDPLPLTHEFLSFMLAVRRPSVSVTLRRLERAGLISQGRARIAIVDREGLLEIAGAHYGMAEAEYERLLGSPIGASPRASAVGRASIT